MRRRVRPHRDAAPRTFGTFRREVVALLAAKGMSGEEATRTALRWNDYVKVRWEEGKPPCAVSDHLMRWSKEKVVCPCKRNGDPSPRCKTHGKRALRARRDPVRLRSVWLEVDGAARDDARQMAPYDAGDTPQGLLNVYRSAKSVIEDLMSESGASEHGLSRAINPREAKALRKMVDAKYGRRIKAHNQKATPVKKTRTRKRTSRDADNPRPGEVYEAKTSGRRWEIVKVDGERVVMRPVGARSEGQLVFSKQSLKGMKTLKGAVQSFVDRVLGREQEDVNPVALEAAARRGSDPGGRRRRLARKAKARRRVRRAR